MSQTLLEKYPHLKALMEKKDEERKEGPSAKQKAGSSSCRKNIMKRPRGPQPPPLPVVSAEQLAADGLEADNAEWLVFNIKQTGWRNTQQGELKSWLEQNKPSKVLKSDGIGWISVICSSEDLEEEDPSVAEMTAQLEGDVKTEWETIEGERNMETVNRLAEKFNHRAGKWLLHISSEWVDKVGSGGGGGGDLRYC